MTEPKKRYIAFEGGGGKGTAFLAVAQALEKILPNNEAFNKLSGYSGSSAGAITAFLLSVKTNSSVLEFIAKFGIFEKLYPSEDKYPGSTDKGYRPFWRSFFQVPNENPITYKLDPSPDDMEIKVPNSTFEYCKIYAPTNVQKLYKHYYDLTTGEAVDNALVNLGFNFSAFAGAIAYISDEFDLANKIIDIRFHDEKESLRKQHLTEGTIANLIATAGLFPGEEVLHCAIYITALVKKHGSLEKLTPQMLPFFDKEVATLIKDNIIEKKGEIEYAMDNNGKIHFVNSKIIYDDKNIYNNYMNQGKTLDNNTMTEDGSVFKFQSKGTAKVSELKKEIYLTFAEHYKLTKKELVLTSVNLSNGITYYFSVYSTPDFPVSVAVTLSMNLPIWSPIYISYKSPKGIDYSGWYFDGGINNNFPFRVFNTDWKNYHLNYKEQDKNNRTVTKHDLWGFMLGEKSAKYLNYFPGSLNLVGVLSGIKLDQSTTNNYYSWDKKYCALSTAGLSTYEFTPKKEFDKTNEENLKKVLAFFEKNEF